MIKLLVIPSLIFISLSCGNSSTSTQPDSKSKEITSILYAKHFKISMKEKQTVLEIMDPETGMIQREIDISPFTQTKNPEPVSIVALSSTHIGMISKLNEANKIVGVSGMQYVSNALVKANFEQKKVIELGEESTIPLEQIIQSKANIIIYSGFGKEFPHQKQLEKLGIICIPNYDWKELHPLGKAEWIKLFGVLLKKEQAANDYFTHIEKEYKSLKELAKNSKKSDCLFSGNVFGDFWYTPAGESFNAQIFKDANCAYAYENSKGIGSLSLTLEEVLQQNATCKYWINPGASTLDELKQQNPKAVFFDAFKKNNVYCYSKEGNNFWEMSAIEPHKVLSDIIQLTHPEMHLEKPLYFYSQLK